MRERFSIKIAGAAGQGIKSSGLIIAKAVKRAGFYAFGYTEYPSLIRGGHNVFQIEVSDKNLGSITHDIDVLLALNKESIDIHIKEFDKDGGVIILDDIININPEQEQYLQEHSVKVYPVPLLNLATEAGGNTLMKNTVSLGAVWKTLGLPIDALQQVVAEIFGDKGAEVIEINRKAVELGFNSITDTFDDFVNKFKPHEEIKDDLIISGNEALCLGAVASGVKIYSSYPMTPASSILTTLAKWAPKTGMLVKQAEDEITAANMCIGANFAGTRALCGTSGGGVDLMSESISLAGITETPFVAILGQRHGAATGAPTWTGQGDLDMALQAGHGEFPRLVMTLSDAKDAFELTSKAFNYAEKYQIPVLLLTEKYIAESFYTVKNFDQSKITVERGNLIDPSELDGTELRYKQEEDGISARWFPGQFSEQGTSRINSTYIANSDEHTEKSYSTEDETIIKTQVEKRMKKLETLKAELPEPEKIGDDNADIIFITWGSNRRILSDAKLRLEAQGKSVQIINFTYLWPLKTEPVQALKASKDKVYIVEQNATGQLAKLIRQETGIEFKNKILRYDSKPFYIEDIIESVNKA